MSHRNVVLLRDLTIFQVKLLLDGLKDIVLMPVTIAATAIDLLFPGPRPGHRFYMVMAAGERFDRWLNLFSASDHADASKDGLFGSRRASRGSMLDEIESRIFGQDGAERDRSARSAS